MPAGNDFFNYLGNKTSGQEDEISERLGAIETALGIKPTSPIAAYSAGTETRPTGEDAKKGGIKGIGKLRKLANFAIGNIRKTEDYARANAADYAQFLASQIGRDQLSNQEASDLYTDFGLAYRIPDAFKTAETLGSMTRGVAPEGAVERYRPFQEFAAKQLGISLSEEDIKGTEAAARALGKTSPEAFSQFLGQKMLTSPEYIRKTPLAFAANLPYGGRYGVGYQKPDGTLTGTFRFKPPSSVDYS